MTELEKHLGIDKSKCVRTQAFWREAGNIKTSSDRSTLKVLRARYTEAGDTKASYAEIANQFNVRESRARELVIQALRRMRHITYRYTADCGAGVDQELVESAEKAVKIFSFLGPAEELVEKAISLTSDDLNCLGDQLRVAIDIPELNEMAFLEWTEGTQPADTHHNVYNALKMRYNFAGTCRATYSQIGVRTGLRPIIAKAVIKIALEAARADLDENIADVYHE